MYTNSMKQKWQVTFKNTKQTNQNWTNNKHLPVVIQLHYTTKLHCTLFTQTLATNNRPSGIIFRKIQTPHLSLPSLSTKTKAKRKTSPSVCNNKITQTQLISTADWDATNRRRDAYLTTQLAWVSEFLVDDLAVVAIAVAATCSLMLGLEGGNALRRRRLPVRLYLYGKKEVQRQRITVSGWRKR